MTDEQTATEAVEEQPVGWAEEDEVEAEVEHPSDLKLDYVTRRTQRKMTTEEKCELILDRIRSDRILIFEGGLDPKDEAELVMQSMQNIDHESFFGLEIYSPAKKSRFRGEARVTVITPANCEISCRTI